MRASARGSASRAGCHRLQAPNITMSGRDTRRVGSADRQDLVACWDCAVRRSLMPPDINHGDATGLLYTVQKISPYYLPSQPQRRGISYVESKTECQPTNHCKLYSSKIPDRSRDRKAHGPCPQAQPLRTSRLDHDPGRLSSWTASVGGLRSPMASGRARPRPHAHPQGQERHAIRSSYPGR